MPTWNPAWLQNYPLGDFGLSGIGTGAAGGTDSSGNPIPTYNLFGGSGITKGFVVFNIPEPSSVALASLGAAVMLMRRRRK